MINTTIEPVNFEASKELRDHIKDHFSALEKYNNQIIKADIYLKNLSDEPVNSKQVEAKFFMPGHEIFVESSDESFISAVQKTYDKAKRQLSEMKDKDKNRGEGRPFKF